MRNWPATTTLFLFFTLFVIGTRAQTPYEGPYIEALVKYKFRIAEKQENPGWGLGFRIDTAGRRYVVIANDGWLTKSEFFYDSSGHTTKEISLQLATGIKHIYTYNYQWLTADTLQSIRSDYGLTTNYIYKNKLLNSVEKIYYGSACKVINSNPDAPSEMVPPNTSCFERVTFFRDSTGEVTGKRFSNFYSKFKALPNREYIENYHKNPLGQVDSVVIGDDGKYLIMAFEYNKKGQITNASRRREGIANYEIWEFAYKRSGLLKKVTYRDFPAKMWVDKYRWKRHKWKKKTPIIPRLSNFMNSYDLKLAEDFYFGY
jgi:LysM repeat protein